MLRALFVQLATNICLPVGEICRVRTALTINTMYACESGITVAGFQGIRMMSTKRTIIVQARLSYLYLYCCVLITEM